MGFILKNNCKDVFLNPLTTACAGKMKVFSDDIELIYALKKGDSRAYNQLYQQLIGQLCYFIENITGHRQVAEDIAAESLVKTFDKLHDFEAIKNLKYFLFRVAGNAALNYIKEERRTKENKREYALVSDYCEQKVEEGLLRSAVIQVVYEEIENLPNQVREVIKLSLIQGKSLSEIAEQMNIAYKTVQNHKTNGLNALRINLLKKRHIGDALVVAAILLVSQAMK